MSEWHPDEVELAEAAEAGASRELGDHLRWCSSCRTAAADYEWLGGEIAEALEAGVQDVAVPKPRWRDLEERLRPDGRSTGDQPLLALAGAVALTCIALVAPSLLSHETQRGDFVSPGPVTVGRPLTTSGDDVRLTGASVDSALTVTPAPSATSREGTVSLPFVPPPEPPEPEG
jgi:hypothetical protein